jgi:transposase
MMSSAYETLMDNNLQIPLDLPDVRVLKVSKIEQGAWLIIVESTVTGTPCRKCGKPITDLHGLDTSIRLRHLPLFEVPVYIELRPKRYRCPHCDGRPTSTQELSWYQRRSPNTKAYEQWLLRMLINSTVTDVSRKLQLSEECVTGAIDCWIETEVNWSAFKSIEVIGIDEISLKRGHRDFVALVTTLTEQGVAILAVLKDRKQETVAAFLSSIPEPLKATAQRVCTDMYKGYVSAAQTQLPQAKIVIDRFHVARAYRDCADKVRKQEMRRLKQELPEAEYAFFKGVMWVFRKSEADLENEELEQLERLFSYSPKIERAYILREELTDIFDRDYTKSAAKCAIQAWCKRVRKYEVEAFESFLTTLSNWLDEITNYFLERQTSGFVEGFNNRVKVLKRRCYGIFDVGRIFQRLTLDISGYERFFSQWESSS